jgi:hypothetical protein
MKNQKRRQTTLNVPGLNSGEFSSAPPGGGRRISVALTRRLSIQLPIAPRPVERAGTIDRLSRVIFPCSFILFNVGYWLYYVYVV